MILVIEDDSQDGADHVDAHRIPALAISPYAEEGAVVHTRYDFLSFIRTLEIATGMKPLNLFDAVAVPLYNVFTTNPDNDSPYEAIVPNVDLTERNTEASPERRALEAAAARLHRPDAPALPRQDPLAVRARRGLGAATARAERIRARRGALAPLRRAVARGGARRGARPLGTRRRRRVNRLPVLNLTRGATWEYWTESPRSSPARPAASAAQRQSCWPSRAHRS